MAHSYHRGEIEVQKRAAVEEAAQKIGRSIRDSIPAVGKAFLESQVMTVSGSVDKHGDVWASLVTGEAGFMRVTTPITVDIHGSVGPEDPLIGNLSTNGQCGMIAVEFSSRRRMRVNGQATVKDGHIMLEAKEVYSNCPRYIQTRKVIDTKSVYAPQLCGTGTELTLSQEHLISKVDTFFITSFHPEAGVDASHKGGQPGFVRVQNSGSIIFPDYNGNRMFNTLGNISVNPNAGLLFIDFDTGSTLQLTGKTEVLWDSDMMPWFPGAERLVKFNIERVIETKSATFVRWKFLAYSPYLPS